MNIFRNHWFYFCTGLFAASAIAILFFMPHASCKRQKVIVWHSMDSVLGDIFNELVFTYNKKLDAEKSNTEIVPVFKGNYDMLLESLKQTAGTDQAPHVAQVFEMGTLVMLHEKVS